MFQMWILPYQFKAFIRYKPPPLQSVDIDRVRRVIISLHGECVRQDKMTAFCETQENMSERDSKTLIKEFACI